MGGRPTYARSTSKLGARVLAGAAVLALGTGLAAIPAGALPTLPTPTLPSVALPAPKPTVPVLPITLPKPLAPLTTPAPKIAPAPKVPVPSVPAPRAIVAPVIKPVVNQVIKPVVAPVVKPVVDQIVKPVVAPVIKPVLAVPPAAVQAVTGAVKNVAGAVAPLAPVTRPVTATVAAAAPTKAPVRAARELVAAPLRAKATTSDAATAREAGPLSAASGPNVRSLNGGGQVRIVPRSVCSTQVAAAQPESTALCRSVTPEEAAELGLSTETESSSFPTIAGLPLTGVSIAGLAFLGALALGLGVAARPFRRSRIAKRAALA